MKISTTELWFLLNQFTPTFVLGIENPYSGWLVDEIENENKNAIKSLLSKGFADQLDDKTLDIDDTLYDMVKICAHPNHTVILQISLPNNESQQLFYHFGENEIIEHTTDNNGEHNLQKVPSMDDFLSQIISSLNLDPEIVGDGQPIKLSENVLSKSIEFLSNQNDEAFETCLQDAGLNSIEISKLGNALRNPLANSSIAILLNQENPDSQQVRGFGMLQSNSDFWLLQPYNINESPQIEFIPTNITSINEKLSEIIPTVKDFQHE